MGTRLNLTLVTRLTTKSMEGRAIDIKMEHTHQPATHPNPEPKAISPASSTNLDPPHAPQKRQPWKAVWPKELSEGRPMQYYGFKEGERMTVPGNAGDFFAHGNWTVEFETT